MSGVQENLTGAFDVYIVGRNTYKFLNLQGRAEIHKNDTQIHECLRTHWTATRYSPRGFIVAVTDNGHIVAFRTYDNNITTEFEVEDLSYITPDRLFPVPCRVRILGFMNYIQIEQTSEGFSLSRSSRELTYQYFMFEEKSIIFDRENREIFWFGLQPLQRRLAEEFIKGLFFRQMTPLKIFRYRGEYWALTTDKKMICMNWENQFFDVDDATMIGSRLYLLRNGDEIKLDEIVNYSFNTFKV